jgi:hypothetical protein
VSFFPLPLAAFEHYMLVDDRPAYPMTFFLRLRFTGNFERSRFHDALSVASIEHPLLRANVHGAATGITSQLAWVDASDKELSVRWDTGHPTVFLPKAMRIDLHRETGLRVSAHEDRDATNVLLQFHHSCADGIGATNFIETLLAAYARGTNSRGACNPSGESADRSFLRARARTGVRWPEHARRVFREASRLMSFFHTTPQPVASGERLRPETGGLADFPGLLSHCFEQAESESIRSRSRQLRVTVNDLLLRDLFSTLDSWNRLHCDSGYAGTLRIAMPMNLRSPADRRPLVANTMSMVFLDRHSSRIAEPESLIHGIHAETSSIKRRQTGLALLSVLRFIGAFPGGLNTLLGGRRCLNSSVLSNLGVVFANSALRKQGDRIGAGDVILEGIEFFPPIRPMTHASFGVVSYGKRLVVGLNYDRWTLTAGDARDLLAAYIGQLKKSIR